MKILVLAAILILGAVSAIVVIIVASSTDIPSLDSDTLQQKLPSVSTSLTDNSSSSSYGEESSFDTSGITLAGSTINLSERDSILRKILSPGEDVYLVWMEINGPAGTRLTYMRSPDYGGGFRATTLTNTAEENARPIWVEYITFDF